MATKITGSSITVGDESVVRYYEQADAPEVAPNGSLWKDTDTGVIFIANNDNGTTVWVQV